MSDYRTFTREDRDGVAVVSFSHPPINLVDRAMVIDLLHLADELERDSDTRVVLLRSANPDFFLAHYDLGSQLDAPPMKLPAGMASPLSALFSRFSRLPQVTIGELRGRARGAGSEFLLALDMRFASRERALLGQPEVAVGLLPGAGGTVRLAQLLGRGRALEVCLGVRISTRTRRSAMAGSTGRCRTRSWKDSARLWRAASRPSRRRASPM